MKPTLLFILSVLATGMLMMPASANSLNDFVIENYDIEYDLSKDNENRSRLETTETVKAYFPNSNRNHGIERAIPQSYDGHKTSLNIHSVTKADGSKWKYETYTSNDNLVVRIGDADTYVSGQQTYVITYSQRDVTRSFTDTNSDEFYWDTNGTEWNVPIRNLSVSLRVDKALTGFLNDNAACYQGFEGSTETCALSKQESVYGTKISSLSPGENVSIAIGFKKGTFGVYQPSTWDKFLQYYFVGLVVVGIIATFLFIWLIVKWSELTNRKKELGTIVPEYVPPRDVSLTAAASLQRNKGTLFTAQLMDFAVRHYIKIYQTRNKSFFRSAEYDIEIIKNISDLKIEEQEILKDIFSGNAAFGSRLSMKSLKNNSTVYNSTLDNEKQLNDLVRGDYGLRQKIPTESDKFKKIGKYSLFTSLVLLNPFLLVVAVTAFICAYTLWPLTDKGLALTRYLEGLKMYISVAEQERLRLLQSPEGAVKVGPVDTNDTGSLVKLYEGVLPFAVLFGQEKEWNKQIGKLYESANSSPSWYSGNSAFNAVAFSSSMNGFSTAASYSSASSSSSGGSGGSGSSGGGGGGGGGGGW